MRISVNRAIALPVAVLSAMALSGVAVGPADAAVVSGSVTLSVNASFLAQLAEHGIGFAPTGYTSLTYSNGVANVTYALGAGDADVSNFAGTAPATGGLLGFDINGGQTVDFNSLVFDLGNSQFDGGTSTSGGEVPLMDIASVFAAESGTTEVYQGSELLLDAAGAALLDSALGTSAFVSGTDIGSFNATWTN